MKEVRGGGGWVGSGGGWLGEGGRVGREWEGGSKFGVGRGKEIGEFVGSERGRDF